MSSENTQNAEAPDPHAAYRAEVERSEDWDLLQATLAHFRARAYSLHLALKAAEARVEFTEADLAASQAQVSQLSVRLAGLQADVWGDTTPDTPPDPSEAPARP